MENDVDYSTTAHCPTHIGWLEKKLTPDQMKYIWDCIGNRDKESYKPNLVGEITQSNLLIDKDNWFYQNVLLPLCVEYANTFRNLGDGLPMNQRHPYYLSEWWVNYQKQGEYNPLHSHDGLYSFVIWMKIPTKHEEQNMNTVSNVDTVSTFCFNYCNILGGTEYYTYRMNPEIEGTMVFFPSKLLHTVYPFYNCEEDRISVSGNITIDTTQVL